LNYTVVLSRQAERYYKKLGEKARKQLREGLIVLEIDAYAGKRLHGDLKEYSSLRVGKMRAIYRVSEKEKNVCIVAIGPRKTIYK
jgi:mRNA-degrading endonuclease RelE of RelBE toxin-antitoxin system